MFECNISDHFSSAHFLREYKGKCKRLHGHTWKVEATVIGEKLDEIGLLADFGELKKTLKGVLDQMDHNCLNDLEFFQVHNPTAENITKFIYQEFKKAVAPLTLKQVRVWESDRTSVTYYEK